MADQNCDHSSWTWQNHQHRDKKGPYNRRWKKCDNSNCNHCWDEEIVR